MIKNFYLDSKRIHQDRERLLFAIFKHFIIIQVVCFAMLFIHGAHSSGIHHIIGFQLIL